MTGGKYYDDGDEEDGAYNRYSAAMANAKAESLPSIAARHIVSYPRIGIDDAFYREALVPPANNRTTATGISAEKRANLLESVKPDVARLMLDTGMSVTDAYAVVLQAHNAAK